MKFTVSGIILLCVFVQVRAQLSCKQCTASSKEGCTEEKACARIEERCMAIRWSANERDNQANTYTMRCATPDECSDSLKRTFCDRKNRCEVKCCGLSNCDPFQKPVKYIEVRQRTFYCHQCRRESLGSCLETEQSCDDDQNACISLLMEGGNDEKVYTKRCARKDECVDSEKNRLCEEERVQTNQNSCRASCCYFDLCNKVSRGAASLFVISVLVCLSMVVLT